MISAAYKKHLATAMAGAALASALAVSGASAHYGSQHQRSTDVAPPPSSIAASAGEEYTDLRMPDTRDAARAAEVESYTDLRSPDARDAGLAEAPSTPLEPQPVAAAPSEPAGFDLASAAIGAIAAAGLSLVLMATLGMRRPGRRGAAA
jgi:hypothetical protein